MQVNYMLDEGAFKPEKAHSLDAGFDLRAPRSITVLADSCYVIDTGVHVEIPEGYVGFLKSKSGLNIKHSITSEGVIDAGYTGSIKVKLYNHTNRYDYNVKKGDKITQLVILPIADCNELTEVSEFKESDRGDHGFGSTGR